MRHFFQHKTAIKIKIKSGLHRVQTALKLDSFYSLNVVLYYSTALKDVLNKLYTCNISSALRCVGVILSCSFVYVICLPSQV
jgi:hypothetical protein